MSESLRGKKVLVVGLGVTGFATARALSGMDASVSVTVTESETSDAIEARAAALRADGITVDVGGHDVGSLSCDLAVLSPGVPPHAPVVRALTERGVTTIGEIELAASLTRCDLLAVTGTNGKTTTTSLLAAMLAEGGFPSAAAGNIGTPLIQVIAEVPEGGAIAVEVSSFQLATIETFHPKVAIVLNIAEDHTDWHGTFEHYLASKARIVENQEASDVLVVNLEDPAAMSIAPNAPGRVVAFSAVREVPEGIGVISDSVVWRGEPVLSTSDISLRGRAGLEDVIAAAGAALEYGVEPAAIGRAIKGFRPLGHRLELVAEAKGVSFIDDSKATNPHATLAAVQGLDDVVLIAGGRSKGIDLAALKDTVPPVTAVVALGESADEVRKVFEGLVSVDIAIDMDDAVTKAAAHAQPGGSVLLSPGCASLDMYESYARRGEDFARAVRALLGGR